VAACFNDKVIEQNQNKLFINCHSIVRKTRVTCAQNLEPQMVNVSSNAIAA